MTVLFLPFVPLYFGERCGAIFLKSTTPWRRGAFSGPKLRRQLLPERCRAADSEWITAVARAAECHDWAQRNIKKKRVTMMVVFVCLFVFRLLLACLKNYTGVLIDQWYIILLASCARTCFRKPGQLLYNLQHRTSGGTRLSKALIPPIPGCLHSFHRFWDVSDSWFGLLRKCWVTVMHFGQFLQNFCAHTHTYKISI